MFFQIGEIDTGVEKSKKECLEGEVKILNSEYLNITKIGKYI